MENYSFEEFILHCCKLEELDLRVFLKTVLTSFNFSIKEDNYVSPRSGEYKKIPNLLALRGSQKNICLVSHTDVCRNHGFSHFSHAQVNPVIKLASVNEEIKKIIQDKDCRVQVGGDDRLGVAINTWIAIHSGYDMGLLFTTDEEIGLLSADEVCFPELNDFKLLVQTDRGNHSNQLVNRIGGIELCSNKTAMKLLQIAHEIGHPRELVSGMITDVYSIRRNNMCKEAVNMTVGYHNSYGDDADEFIDIEEAKECLKFVSTIIKTYDLEEINNHSPQENSENSSNVMPIEPNHFPLDENDDKDFADRTEDNNFWY